MVANWLSADSSIPQRLYRRDRPTDDHKRNFERRPQEDLVGVVSGIIGVESACELVRLDAGANSGEYTETQKDTQSGSLWH